LAKNGLAQAGTPHAGEGVGSRLGFCSELWCNIPTWIGTTGTSNCDDPSSGRTPPMKVVTRVPRAVAGIYPSSAKDGQKPPQNADARKTKLTQQWIVTAGACAAG